jgi:methyl-accepting chemotaxis protein
MKLWHKLKVSTRLYLAIGLVAVVFTSLMASSYIQQKQANSVLQDLAGTEYTRMREVAQWQTLASGVIVRMLAVSRSADPWIVGLFKSEIPPLVKQIQSTRESIRTWATSTQEKEWFARLDQHEAAVLRGLEAINKAREDDDLQAAGKVFDQQLLPNATAYENAIDEFVEMQKSKVAAQTREAQESAWRQWQISTLVLGALVLLSSGIVLNVVRYIVGSLERAVRLTDAVSAGDLTQRVQVKGDDEFAMLMRGMSGMSGSLQQIVMRVRDGAVHVATASQQIAQGNNDLSGRTEQQASRLQQTASIMEQLSGAVRLSAQNAGQADHMASEARAVALKSGAAVEQVVHTMGQIEDASRRIEDIIHVIDGVAFQTNLLSLNAAVEAARAGEQGRGFAVVANEVRQLAQRTAASAKEIKALIADSADKVRVGGAQVETAGQTIAQLVQVVQQVGSLINEISAAAAEQNHGISGVTHAVSEIDRATQQNSALVEEAAAAAGSLREHAAALSETVGTFKV